MTMQDCGKCKDISCAFSGTFHRAKCDDFVPKEQVCEVIDDICAKVIKSASDLQVGGQHYKDMAIQPAEFSQRNNLNFLESNIIKYASRHGSKNGAEDVRKIIHCAQLILEWTYNEKE